MSREEFEQWAEKNGWKRDRFGHYHKGDLRLKLQAKTVRLERSHRTEDTQYRKGEKRWIRIRSGYYGKLSLSAENKLIGLKR